MRRIETNNKPVKDEVGEEDKTNNKPVKDEGGEEDRN